MSADVPDILALIGGAANPGMVRGETFNVSRFGGPRHFVLAGGVLMEPDSLSPRHVPRQAGDEGRERVTSAQSSARWPTMRFPIRRRR
jgi:hypothetical protein